MKTSARLKIACLSLGVCLASGGFTANIFAQSAEQPTARIWATTEVVRAGAVPKIGWEITQPVETVTDLVTVTDNSGGGTSGGDSTVTAKTKLKISVHVLGVAFGTGTTTSAQLPCRLYMKGSDLSTKFLFIGRGSPVTGEIDASIERSKPAYGQDIILEEGEELDFEFEGASGKNRSTPRTPLKNYMSDWKWDYSTYSTHTVNQKVIVLKNGDPVPSYVPAYKNQDTIKGYLKDYLTADGKKIKIGDLDLIYLTECSTAVPGDMQDIVWKVTFTKVAQ